VRVTSFASARSIGAGVVIIAYRAAAGLHHTEHYLGGGTVFHDIDLDIAPTA